MFLSVKFLTISYPGIKPSDIISFSVESWWEAYNKQQYLHTYPDTHFIHHKYLNLNHQSKQLHTSFEWSATQLKNSVFKKTKINKSTSGFYRLPVIKPFSVLQKGESWIAPSSNNPPSSSQVRLTSGTSFWGSFQLQLCFGGRIWVFSSVLDCKKWWFEWLYGFPCQGTQIFSHTGKIFCYVYVSMRAEKLKNWCRQS